MSYNQKTPVPGGSGMCGGPPTAANNVQQVAKTFAGIQQQMQNLVHGQNTLQQSPQADLNALLQQQRIQNMFKQQQQLTLHFQQQMQQQQQQHYNLNAAGGVPVPGIVGSAAGSGGEPLALTRTSGAADLLNKTYQQQANGNPTGNPALNQLQQQFSALPANIMQQLQAIQYQMHSQAKHLQHTQGGNQNQQHIQQHGMQPSAPNHQQQTQKHASQQNPLSAVPGLQFPQRYLTATAQVAVSGNKQNSTPPPTSALSNQIKPHNLPPHTQITSVSPTSGAVAVLGVPPVNSAHQKSTTAVGMSCVTSSKHAYTPTAPSISLSPAKQNPSPAIAHQQNKFNTNLSNATSKINAGPCPTTEPPMAYGQNLQKSLYVAGASVSSTQHNAHNAPRNNTNVDATGTALRSPQSTPVQLTKTIPPTTPQSSTTSLASNKSGNTAQPTSDKVNTDTVATSNSTQKTLTQLTISSSSSISSATSPDKMAAKFPAETASSANSNLVDLKKSENNINKSFTHISESNNEDLNDTNKNNVIKNEVEQPESSLKANNLTSKSTVNANTIENTCVSEAQSVEHTANKENLQLEDKNICPPKTNHDKDLTNFSNTLKLNKEKSSNELSAPVQKLHMVTVDYKSASGNESNQDVNKTDSSKSIETIVEDDSKQIDEKLNNNQTRKIDNTPIKNLIKKDTQLTTCDTAAAASGITSVPTLQNSETDNLLNSDKSQTSKPQVTPSLLNATIENETKSANIKSNQIESNLKNSDRFTNKEETIASNTIEKVEGITTKESDYKNTVSNITTNTDSVVPSTTPNDITYPIRKAYRQNKTPKRTAKTLENKGKANSKANEMSGEKSAAVARVKRKATVESYAAVSKTPARKIEATNSPKTDRKSQRHRLKTILYQSPLPELAYITKLSASEASNSPKPLSSEDRLIVFYKNEYMAVRNTEGTFYLCQTMQNVYRTSPRISIRWLSEDAKDPAVYVPDFYDHTDIECVLTTVDLKRIDKGHLRLPKTEKARIESILKKALDVEKGIVPRPELTEENPDGLDISLYKDESQIEKKSTITSNATSSSLSTAGAGRKSRRPVAPSTSIHSGVKENYPTSNTETTSNSVSSNKRKNAYSRSSPVLKTGNVSAKKRKTLNKRKRKQANNTSNEEEQDSTDDMESDKDYKPNQKRSSLHASVTKTSPRAQRSPLARARVASPIIPVTPTTSKSVNVPHTNISTPSTSKVATVAEVTNLRTSISQPTISLPTTITTTSAAIATTTTRTERASKRKINDASANNSGPAKKTETSSANNKHKVVAENYLSNSTQKGSLTANKNAEVTAIASENSMADQNYNSSSRNSNTTQNVATPVSLPAIANHSHTAANSTGSSSSSCGVGSRLTRNRK